MLQNFILVSHIEQWIFWLIFKIRLNDKSNFYEKKPVKKTAIVLNSHIFSELNHSSNPERKFLRTYCQSKSQFF